MLTHSLRIAWRHLIRHKFFSIINVLGLTLGLLCSMLTILWIQDERSVDSFHAHGKQLFQIYERQLSDGKSEAGYNTQGLLAIELKRNIPEVEYSSAVEQNHPFTFKAGEKVFKMDGTYAGNDFFEMFSYPLLQGSAATALNESAGIAISRKMAMLFFGSPQHAMGMPIRMENNLDLKVSAVFEDLPGNSSLQFDFLRSWKAYVEENRWVENWGNASPYTFLQIRPGTDPNMVEQKIKNFIDNYRPRDPHNITELALQPFSERYLYSNFKNGRIDGGRIEYVRLFSLVAALMLLIACINFMNMATARSAQRAREVGVRKVIGARRFSLTGQFLGEALLLSFFSILVTLALVFLLLPAFNQLTGKSIVLPIGDPNFWLGLAGLCLVTGFLSGGYPALYLASLNPIRVLKGRLSFGNAGILFRKGLVVFQFAFTIMMIVGMIVIYQQLKFVQTKNLGYSRENLLYIPLEGGLIRNYDLFKEQAAKIPGIRSISKMKESPTVIGHTKGDISWPGKDPQLAGVFSDASVGYDFVQTMKLTLADGRDFSREFHDSASYLINETAARKIGYQDAVGKPLAWGSSQGRIIGVIRDFHFNSMHVGIEPLVIRLAENISWGTILVRTDVGKTAEAIGGLEKICKTINPDYSFSYQFSDQEYAKLYRSEQVVSKLINYFALLAILISCLGLFGLAGFTVSRRAKEISVRKALGASVSQITAMLLSGFLKPIVLAIFIAFPLSWYAMHRWLEQFAYQIHLSWWVFGLAAMISLATALLTVCYQSIKASVMNPVKNLRTE